MVTEDDLKANYNSLREYATLQLARGNLDSCFSCVETLAHWVYDTGIKDFAPELDELIKGGALSLGVDVSKVKAADKRVVFVDYYGLDNKGLSEQYVRAFLELGFPLLYINLNESREFRSGSIFNVLAEGGADVVCLSKKLGGQKKIIAAYEAIKHFSPSHIVAHTAAWDVVAPALCFLFPQVIKLNVNITDHAFWLGSGVFDYCLNFREFGSDFCVLKRNMHPDQQLLVPMYPVIPQAKLSSLPFEKKDRDVILVTCGAFYKIFDVDDSYLRVVRDVLSDNPCARLYFIGRGDSSHINDFIRRERLEDRFFLLGERSDFFEILKRADIYIGTFPVGGGLMTQYSAMAGLPFVSLKQCQDSFGRVLSVLKCRPKLNVLFDTVSECGDELNKLISDEAYRALRAEDFHKCAPMRSEFESALNNIFRSCLYPKARYSECIGLEQGFHNVSLANKQKEVKYYLIPLYHMKFGLLFFNLPLFFKAGVSLVKRVLVSGLRYTVLP